MSDLEQAVLSHFGKGVHRAESVHSFIQEWSGAYRDEASRSILGGMAAKGLLTWNINPFSADTVTIPTPPNTHLES